MKPKSIAGYQRWTDLTFLHWQVDPQQIQNLLPDGLMVETFDGAAWMAIVPFSMERVRPWWSPAVPGISWFLETNVRTYVRHESGQSAVWFFSLDANHRLAVWVARSFWHLNYQFAQMSMSVTDGSAAYSGKRPGESSAGYNITAGIDYQAQLTTAEPGSLEHFLFERYHLLAERPDGRFYCSMVHHEPYRYLPLTDVDVSQTLTSAAGCDMSVDQPPDHAAFSPGVDVVVSPLKLVEG